jgi:hypothetical protein
MYHTAQNRQNHCASVILHPFNFRRAPMSAPGSVPSFRTCACNGRFKSTKVRVSIYPVDMSATSFPFE